MDRKTRTRLFLGIILVLVGGWFLLVQWFPDLKILPPFEFSWPWFVIGAGILLMLLGLLVGEPDMLVPACVVGGIGGLLYWQNETGNWASWAYVWTMIPGFVGIGVFLSGLIKGKRSDLKDGLNLVLISMILFAVFAGFFGQMEWAALVGAVALILGGLSLILRSVFRKK
jgi:hypothetical protein